MTKDFAQVLTGAWPSGDSKALTHLRIDPSEIASKLGVVFTSGEDDLGSFVEAGIRFSSGRLMLFVSYTVIQEPGVSVLVDSDDDEERALQELKSALSSPP